jgi:malonate transporter
MQTLVEVAFPIFAIVLTGYLAGQFGILGAQSAAALNRFVYYFALPPVLFVFTARAPIAEILNWPFIAAFLGGTVLTLIVALVGGRFIFGHDTPRLAMHGLTAVFANTAYMGIPLFLTAFGPDGALPAIVGTLVANTLLIGGAIAAMETVRAKGSSLFDILSEVARTLVRNPLMVAPILGIFASLLTLPIPKPIGNYLDLLAAAAGPAALFALGLSLVGRRLTAGIGEVSWLVILKLGLQPVLTFILVRWVFNVEPVWAEAAIILAALPAGALVFVLAQQYETYVDRASAAIVVSTVLSVATVSGLLIWLEIG